MASRWDTAAASDVAQPNACTCCKTSAVLGASSGLFPLHLVVAKKIVLQWASNKNAWLMGKIYSQRPVWWWGDGGVATLAKLLMLYSRLFPRKSPHASHGVPTLENRMSFLGQACAMCCICPSPKFYAVIAKMMDKKCWRPKDWGDAAMWDDSQCISGKGTKVLLWFLFLQMHAFG